MRAAVVVLGDLPRSPRIVLHARALDDAGVDVDLIGFSEPGWRPAGASPRLHVHALSDRAGAHLPLPARAVARGVALSWGLTRLLGWTLPRPDLILVQNPPGVPTLAVAWAAARLRRARFAIDWHNLTASMLALRLGNRHLLVNGTSAYEGFFSRRADVNLFVSAAMRDTLLARWGARGQVFRDRSARHFQPLDEPVRGAARVAILDRLGEPATALLAVTSTSWSSDEDFDLLFDALLRLETRARESFQTEGRGPRRLVVVITGRGPLRDAFARRFAEAGLRHVSVHCEWLEAGEYPRMLAGADVGISLHRSASGLDLPMKVLDMFGAGLPVCALDYGPCLRELVVDGRNGLLFQTAEQLSAILATVLAPGGDDVLDRLRHQVGSQTAVTWETAWRDEVGHLFVKAHAG